jgi:UDP-N-acetyl-D-mannosaminuronic acid dehydrogenase
MANKVFIIGGLGHVGLTLAAVLNKHYPVVCYDTNDRAFLEFFVSKKALFNEPGLNDLLKDSTIEAVQDQSKINDCRWIVITIGTTIDEYGNPRLKDIFEMIRQWIPYLTKDMTIVMRSTVYPGVSKKIEELLRRNNVQCPVAFCPERTAENKMIEELRLLPQIISSNSVKGLDEAAQLFSPTGVKLKYLNDTTSGELAKLFTNSYRYIHFAIANQMFMLSHKLGCDFYKIFDAMVYEYPRLASFPKPGFAAGYCLRKDTLQLTSWDYQQFSLGYDASIVNENLPLFIFRKIRDKFGDLSKMTIGLLGMAFKPDSDDIRDSLAFRMK